VENNLEIAIKLVSQSIISARGADMMYRAGHASWGRSAALKASKEAMKANLLLLSLAFSHPERSDIDLAYTWASYLAHTIETRLLREV
jgi:hypothetical protein